jgi:hypothetical protein
MSVTYQLDPETGFIETHCKGDVTFDEVMRHFQALEADPLLPECLDVLLDLGDLTSVPESGQLQQVAGAVGRLRGKVRWGACAIVAISDVLFGMSRMFEVFADQKFASTHVFRGRADAKHWLAQQRSLRG